MGSRRVSVAEAGDLMRSIGALETVMRPLDDLAAQTNSDPDLAPLAESIGDARRSLSFFSQNLLAQARAGGGQETGEAKGREGPREER